MAHSTDSLALDVVVPVYNEEATLTASVRTLHAYLQAAFGVSWRITIADNASTDGTAELADALVADLPKVGVIHLQEKGRGRAVKAAWGSSTAEVLVYLDEDLSTDLAALPPLVAPLFSGHSDLAIGTRLGHASRVTRGSKREFVSRSYNLLLRRMMAVSFTDAQCGFKAIRRDVAQQLLPLVEDNDWFFDTELLILAERSGLRIHEIPVDWVDDPHSSVDIVRTASADLKGMFRVGSNIARGRIPLESIYAELGRRPFEPPAPPSFFGQVVRFAVVGVVSTFAYALLYLGLQSVLAPQVANFLALLLTAIANTWANRRFTFGVRGPRGAIRQQFQGLIVFAIAWGVTSGSLAALDVFHPDASTRFQLIVLTIANLVATLVRFVLLRVWVFRAEARRAPVESRPEPAPDAVANLAPHVPESKATEPDTKATEPDTKATEPDIKATPGFHAKAIHP